MGIKTCIFDGRPCKERCDPRYCERKTDITLLAVSIEEVKPIKAGNGVEMVMFALPAAVRNDLVKAVKRAAKEMAPPTEAEISAYRDLFRAELSKRMDTKHPSASPSTEAHAIALKAFVDKRNTERSS